MRKRGFLWLGLIIMTIITLGFGLYAQDSESTNNDDATVQDQTNDDAAVAEAATDETSEAAVQDQTGAMDWEEAIFVLMVIAIVMMGLIGFEWIQRRKQSFR